jgi:hypothetical protein
MTKMDQESVAKMTGGRAFTDDSDEELGERISSGDYRFFEDYDYVGYNDSDQS